MPYCKDRNGIRVDAIAGHVAAVPEVDDPLAELVGPVLDGTADARLLHQYSHPLAEFFTACLAAVRFLEAKKR